MLMIFGKYDEYRERMTGTNDVEAEWMRSPQTQAAFGNIKPEFGTTYGDFDAGTARRVVLLPNIHIQESHSRQGVAEAVTWMRAALEPDDVYWIAADRQIWEIKEWATLVAMVAGFASVLPLGVILLRTKFFSSLQGTIPEGYTCTRREFFKHATVNGLLMWLYLPVILILFAVHVYVIPIDKVFPMMMVNGTVWWFVLTNVIGFLILKRWRKRRADEVSWADLGLSFDQDRFVRGLESHRENNTTSHNAIWLHLPVRSDIGTAIPRRLPLPLPLRQRSDALPLGDVATVLPFLAPGLPANRHILARADTTSSKGNLVADVRLVVSHQRPDLDRPAHPLYAGTVRTAANRGHHPLCQARAGCWPPSR